MWQTTRGLVLRTVKYSDTQMIATVYTEAFGRASLRVPLTRARRAAVKASLFRPLALVELEADIGRKAVGTLKEARPIGAMSSLPFHPYKAAMAMFLAEFLYGVLREEVPNGALFAYLAESVAWLDRCEESCSNFHLVFLMRLLRFLGLRPSLEGYAEGDWFDLCDACFTPVRPTAHADCLAPGEAAWVIRLMRLDFETMRFCPLNRVGRERCLEVLMQYYRLHLPDFRPPKSLGVLKEVFEV